MQFIYTPPVRGSYGYRISLPKTIFLKDLELTNMMDNLSTWNGTDKEFELDGMTWVSWEFDNRLDFNLVLDTLEEKKYVLKNWRQFISLVYEWK